MVQLFRLGLLVMDKLLKKTLNEKYELKDILLVRIIHYWRRLRDSLRDIQIITCFKFLFILTLIFCHNVAITPGLQTTVSSVVWSACFCCIWHRLQADFQPVRIPHKQKKRNTNSKCSYFSFLAARVPLSLNF